MDSLITAAARALSRGDPLGALKRVALRDDAPALALRGIAMAQLGDLARARELLRRAARAFGPREIVARARCVVAEAEIALVSRELGDDGKLEAARAALEAHGDRANAAYARYLAARRLLLIGRLDGAEEAVSGLDVSSLPPGLRAAVELVVAGIAMRRVRAREAGRALARATRLSTLPALGAEIEGATAVLRAPAARAILAGEERPVTLAEIETLFASRKLVVDACRNAVRSAGRVVPLGTRPVLFALVRTLAEAWPRDASRVALLHRAFGARDADLSHRARLRVEIGRLRKELRGIAEVGATKDGFALRATSEVVLLLPVVESEHAAVLAHLADGESWSSSSLALALGVSQRSVQRSLEVLAEKGAVQSFGRGRARRWISAPVPGFPTALLLPGSLPGE